MQTKTLSLSFNLPILPQEIPQWRGAFIQMAGWENDLFHNHISKDKYHYRYPLIQYRIRRGNAAILAINEGVAAVQQVLATSDWQVQWQGTKVGLQIDDLRMDTAEVEMLETPRNYRLYKWLALNDENYQKWGECRNLVERIALLQRVLRSQVMSTLWGLGWTETERVEVEILDLYNRRPVRIHGTNLLAFEIAFSCNVALPAGVGIGKSVSHGFGGQYPQRLEDNRRNDYTLPSKRTIMVKG